MTPRTSRMLPASLRLLVFSVGWALIACLTTFGAASATTDPNPDIPTGPVTPIPGLETTLSERCQRAVDTFFAEIDWILSHDSDHPRMEDHVDTMWRAWEIAEFECGIDVGGDGEIGY